MPWIRKLTVKKVKPNQVTPGVDTGWVGSDCVYTRTVIPPTPIHTEACPDIPFDHPDTNEGCCCYCVYIWRREQQSSVSSQSPSESQSESQSESPSESQSQSPSESQSESPSESPSESQSESLSQSQSQSQSESLSESQSQSQSQSQSISQSNTNEVCWYFYTATYNCTSETWSQGTPTKACALENAYSEHDWSISSPCAASKVVKGSLCDADEDCTIPSEADPTIPPGIGCCDYYKFTCTATPDCIGETRAWSVTKTTEGPLPNKLTELPWTNTPGECADYKVHWISTTNGGGTPSYNCDEPSVAVDAECIDCSVTSVDPGPCPPLSPPIGYVTVVINDGAGMFNPLINGTYTIPIDGSGGGITIFCLPGAGYDCATRGAVSVHIYCNTSTTEPCPENSCYYGCPCKCLGTTQPAGYYYHISVQEIFGYPGIGGGGYSKSANFHQTFVDGISRQSYLYFSNIGGTTHWCDSAVTAYVL